MTDNVESVPTIPAPLWTKTEWGFLYDGKPEWSITSEPWSRDAAWFYRREAALWRVSTSVGGLIHRVRTRYVDALTDWQSEVGEHANPPVSSDGGDS